MFNYIQTQTRFLWARILMSLLILPFLAAFYPTTAIAGKSGAACIGCNISGPNPTPQGSTATYNLTGSCLTGATNWTVSCGSVLSFTSTSATIHFGNCATAIVNATNPSGTLATITITLSAPPPLYGGTISNPTQGVYSGGTPGTLITSTASGGSCNGVFGYKWYSSADDINFNVIAGETGQNYAPTNITQKLYFARQTSCSGYFAWTTDTAVVNIYQPLSGGAVGPIDTAINCYTSPGTLSVNGVTGGSGTYAYQWYVATVPGYFSPIPGATGATYAPGSLTANAYYEVAVSSAGDTANSSYASIVVYPPVSASVSPASQTIAFNTVPGSMSAGGGGGTGTYAYQWYTNASGSFQPITGATARNYAPTAALTATTSYYVKVTSNGASASSAVETVTVGAADESLNYIKQRSLFKPGVTTVTAASALTDPHDVQQSIQYFDGLGRSVQTVAQQSSPLGNDMVTINAYDAYGREALKYLPYTSPSTNGIYKPNALTEQNTFNTAQFPTDHTFYGEVNYEPSPLNRVLTTYAAGDSWVGANRGVSTQYLANVASDSVHIWNILFPQGSLPTDAGPYPAGTLYKTISTDEQNNQTIEFKDKDGHVVLKKVQAATSPGAAYVGWLCTYYVYDDLANLRFVITPQAVTTIDNGTTWTITQTIAAELCFRYEYDGRHRLIIKKIPGAGEVHSVFDLRDRLVMTQDSNMRAQNQWLVTAYDPLNRPDSTGTITDPTNTMAYHQTKAMLGGEYPNWTSYTNQLFTRTFYDTYTAISAASGLTATMAGNKTSNSSYFITSYGTGPVYAVALTAHPITRGLVTGTASDVISTAPSTQFLYAENFYDDRGRLIQTLSTNYSYGHDTLTTQYNFSGKVLRTLLGQQNATNGANYHQVLTKNNYDAQFRLTSIYKNIDGAASDQIIDSMRYDELGQLRTKNLGKDPATGLPLDSLIYDYNIRGWVTGINKNYVGGTTNHYFGMELGYDRSTSIASGTSYSPLYNGNIAGTVWKSVSDGVNRKYDFTYDNSNRLLGAAYTDNLNGGSWGATKMDFTSNGLSYDANGNILTMTQKGFKVGSPTAAIDQLTYTYQTNSNKLSGVVDLANDSASTLGDFHYKPSTKGSSDYAYDGNGNLTQDANKGLVAIIYNYMNLPALISKGSSGAVYFSYDASGNKLLKQVITYTPTYQLKTTLYMGGLQYVQKVEPYLNLVGIDSLQFVGTEEGRARWAYHKHLAGDTAYSYEYDFAERDQLGDERVMLSQEKDTAQYMCTMEPQYRATENALFYNVDSVSYPAASVTGISGGFPPPPNGPAVNDSVIRLNGNGPKMGPAIILKVMAGDKVTMGTYYYYNPQSSTPTSPLTAQNLVSSLVSGLATLSPIAQEGTVVLSGASSSALQAALTSVSSNDTGSLTSRPQAYLNWVSLDNQFNPVTGSLQNGALQVKTAGLSGTALQSPLGQTITVLKSGYLYIYLSNTSKGWDVFFDNLSILHYSSPLIEENHYYPFGLGIAGISDQAIKTQYAENKYRFNKGSELQSKEFADGSGLEMYETQLRSLDPQLGRWWQIDSKPNFSESPYAAMGDDPVLRNDPFGDTSNPQKHIEIPIPQKKWPGVYKTLMEAIAKGKSPTVNYDSDKQSAEKRSRDAKAGHPAAKPGFNLHEFPPKMATQGGKGAVVNEIPERENKQEGGVAGGIIRAAGLQTGDEITYVPVPDNSENNDGEKIYTFGVNDIQNTNTNSNQNQDEPSNVINMNDHHVPVKVAAATAVGVGAGYLIYKTIVAAATWECGFCGLYLTP